MTTSDIKSKSAARKTTPGKKTTAPAKAAVKAAVKAQAEKPTAKPAVSPASQAAVKPTLVNVSSPVVTQADLKKKELIDLVVERSDIKKKDAKPVIEAMLAVLGETIASGRELNLQPLGKLRINRTVEKGNGRIFICKLRQSLAAANAGKGSDSDTAKQPLAEAPDKL